VLKPSPEGEGAEKRDGLSLAGDEKRFSEVEICFLAFEAWAQTLPW